MSVPPDDSSELPRETVHLLRDWHGGDAAALHELVRRELPWIQARVIQRLGPLLRSKADPEDYVQDAVIRVLQFAPRFVMSDRGQFRSLLARMTENMLRDEVDHHRTDKRNVDRERGAVGDSLLDLDPPVRSVTRPSGATDRNQRRAWARLAVEMLPPEERSIVRMRQWEERSFAEIGEELGISRDAAKMRFQRLLPKLARTVTMLQAGRLADLLADG